MDEPKSLDEETLQRLLQSSIGAAARPDEALRVETLALLKAEVRKRRPEEDFPLPALVLISVVLALMAAWLVLQPGDITNPGSGAVTVLLGLNLLWIPIASWLIVQRRPHVPKN